MSIIIEDMTMPECCMKCPMKAGYGCGYMRIAMTTKDMKSGRHEDCPLEEVEDNTSGITDGWISVKDRLPKKGQVVLWCNDDGNSFTSAITYECKGYWAIGNRHRRSKVIAWMPLPPAFKPKEDK